jgi:hypothetical protein
MDIKAGDIVQITNEEHHWYPCLIIVSEPKSFGCQGYTTIPKNDEEPSGNAYIRLEHSDYEPVGRALVVVQ